MSNELVVRVWYPVSKHRLEQEIERFVYGELAPGVWGPALLLANKEVLVLDPRCYVETVEGAPVYNPWEAVGNMQREMLDWMRSHPKWAKHPPTWKGATVTWAELRLQGRQL